MAADAQPQYGNSAFWESRYREETAKTAFDWYLTYNGLKEVITMLKYEIMRKHLSISL